MPSETFLELTKENQICKPSIMSHQIFAHPFSSMFQFKICDFSDGNIKNTLKVAHFLMFLRDLSAICSYIQNSEHMTTVINTDVP